MLPAVLLHFHPDWPHGDGTVIDAMTADGRYRSQFETGTSNGGLTAHRGGDRWLWESRLFDGRYDEEAPAARPLYGAVDLGEPYGAAPRFGSAFLRLNAVAGERSTFCYPDSVFQPEGVRGADGLSELAERMAHDDVDVLDRYVEAHIHGGIRFTEDVEVIVLDPCFRGTAIEASAARLGCRVEFHPGFRARSDALDPAYRGTESVALAQSLAADLTPHVIGVAARSGRYDAQQIKKVWHLLARYGRSGEPV